MGLLVSLINLIIQLFKTLYIYRWIIIMIMTLILMKIYYPNLRGYIGELKVRIKLNKLNKKEYIVLNDIMINIEDRTHQIDHIVLSRYGIFVIEMKNYYGLIVGEDINDKWIQYLGKNKSYFKNPLYQNYGHIKSLERLL